MKALGLEFYKCRRRKIFLVGLALLAAQLLWIAVSLRRMDASDLRQGWLWLLYYLTMIDSFMLPMTVAVIASRNCEMEHKGSTLKSLETLTTPGGMPYEAFGCFTLISWLVSMMLYTLQQGLSLRFANQALPLIIGLAGSFLGLMALFFPMEVQRLLPWSYYGLFALVGMDWDAATLVSTFYWREPQMLDAALFMLWFLVFFVVGRTLFVRKEV